MMGVRTAAALVASLLSVQLALAQAPPAAAPAAPAPAPPPTPRPFEEALLRAANDLFSKAAIPEGAPPRVTLVIDPLIDGVTGWESVSTRVMERKISDLVQAKYSRFDVRPLSAGELRKSPILLIGTFTPINNAGKAGAPKDVYRICLALADLGSKKIISKGVARATFDGIDATPPVFFAEAPVFTRDATTESYIKTCQGTRPGDPMDAAYAQRILAAAGINDAVKAYDGGRMEQALELFEAAAREPGGDQLRVLNGIYMTNWRLGRRGPAAAAFRRLVDYGLEKERLAIRFLFGAGSTRFIADRRLSAPYPMWIEAIGAAAAPGTACLEVTGHTSATGPAALNERLSVLRAERVRDRIAAGAPAMRSRMIATGVGSKQMMVGTGKDDLSDSLDRRVEFKVIASCTPQQRSASLH